MMRTLCSKSGTYSTGCWSSEPNWTDSFSFSLSGFLHSKVEVDCLTDMPEKNLLAFLPLDLREEKVALKCGIPFREKVLESARAEERNGRKESGSKSCTGVTQRRFFYPCEKRTTKSHLLLSYILVYSLKMGSSLLFFRR